MRLNFANLKAQELWEMTWEEITRMPSRRTAEAPSREERARLLERVHQHGYIDNYSGLRISKSGRRFRITSAIVWNVMDDRRRQVGQAAMFTDWEKLPAQL